MTVQQVLVYGDSLSWGIVPDTRRRLAHHLRWPGALEMALNAGGTNVRIIEDCLNGRRTVWDDPYKPGRRGVDGLAQRIEVNSPLSLVILMLGTNDFQSMHSHEPWHSAQGVGALVSTIRAAPVEPGMPTPQVLIVAPPPIGKPRGAIADKFHGAERSSAGLAAALRSLAIQMNCDYFDAGTVSSSSRIDGVHLDVDQHAAIAQALVAPVSALLAREA